MTMTSATVPVREGRTLAETTIGGYLIERLQALGVEDVFGIPGDYILTLYKMLEESPIRLVGMTREDNAGFAADAYARLRGLGCVCVTYCVGGLSACNSIAGAYAEKSPVIVVSGSPGLRERERNPLLHHKVREFSTQLEVFEKITVASAVLDDPAARLRRDRPRARRGAPVQAAGLSRDPPRHGPGPLDGPAPPARRPAPERPRCAPRSPRRSRRAAVEGEAADDPRRRRGPPLRPAGRPDRAGRVGQPADRDDDPGQERRSPRGIPCSSASTRGRWAATR